MKKHRKIIVTSALPYANGALHLGNIVEFIQTDIWVRFQRLQKHLCLYICGDDAHGTPIMLKAEKMGITPEALIARVHEEHKQDLQRYYISVDNFYTTHSQENRELSEFFYKTIAKRGDIEKRTIRQAFDPIKHMFLPDRYVKGTCPRCKAVDQYGDSCEVCGATYSPTELINPTSVISGATPIEKTSEHFFFALNHHQASLQEWFSQSKLQTEMVNKLEEWFKEGLKAWDITRDGPYFGFEIPESPGQYFYVWLDAPIGYLASFKNYLSKHPNLNITFDDVWAENSEYEVYHFIGKDIIYFHALFWPALLESVCFRKPTSVFAHGFLTINGQKMSKSRGTFIEAKTFATYLDPEHLRYYLAAKLTDKIDDIDFHFDDFIQRINSDLVGKFVNIASRCAGFINKNFEGKLADTLENEMLYQSFLKEAESIAKFYDQREFSKAVRAIMALADIANQYIDQHKPWQGIKEPHNHKHVHLVCTMALNLFRVMACYLKPILPRMAELIESFLNIKALMWDDIHSPLLNHSIHTYIPLTARVDEKNIQSLKENSIKENPMNTQKANTSTTITIDDFAKIDLRIAKIIEAESVEGARSLLKLKLDLGDEQRQVFAGIKEAYNPEDLIGKLTVMVANLEHRKMRFGVSEGMVLAAGTGAGGKDIWLLEPDEGAKPGMRVK